MRLVDQSWLDPQNDDEFERAQRMAGIFDLGYGHAIDSPHFWRESALCAQTDPDIFFPEKGGSTAPAISVCEQCEVRAECLEYALSNDIRHGIWGGLSDNDRRRIQRTRRLREQEKREG